MALQLAKVQGKAKAATANDYGTIKEGDTLFALVPVNGVEQCGTPTRADQIPWTVVEHLVGDDVYPIFKRLVIPLDQAYCQDQLFLDAARSAGLLKLDDEGNPIVGEDGQVQFAVNSAADELVKSGKLTPEQVAEARKTKYLWVAAKVAWRPDKKANWIPKFEKTQVYTESAGSASKPAPHRIFLDAIGDDGDGVIGNMDQYIDARARGENPEPPTIRLVKITRMGSQLQGTTYSGGIVTEGDFAKDDEKSKALYLEFKPDQFMLDDMFAAIQPGAYANPHTFVAQAKVPSQEEIDRRCYGKGEGEGGKRSEMSED